MLHSSCLLKCTFSLQRNLAFYSASALFLLYQEFLCVSVTTPCPRQAACDTAGMMYSVQRLFFFFFVSDHLLLKCSYHCNLFHIRKLTWCWLLVCDWCPQKGTWPFLRPLQYCYMLWELLCPASINTVNPFLSQYNKTFAHCCQQWITLLS